MLAAKRAMMINDTSCLPTEKILMGQAIGTAILKILSQKGLVSVIIAIMRRLTTVKNHFWTPQEWNSDGFALGCLPFLAADVLTAVPKCQDTDAWHQWH